ncbi:MAG: hypothetical protein ACRC9E_14625, partial [Plesiomonas shigelloides]
ALSPMLVPWQTLLAWAAPVALPEVEKTLTEAQRKLRYQARKQLSERAAKVPGLADAGKRLGFNNNSILRAEAAQYVYAVDEFNRGARTDLPAAPVGLSQVDTKKIPGLGKAEFTNKTTGFGAALFKSSINNETMLTYRGTNNAVTGRLDWMTNGAQGIGSETKQYNQAMYLATQVQDAVASPSSPLVAVGHSLGGGLASAGVGATGLPGYTFNAAGLHANTVSRKGGLPLEKIGELITTQAVDGEVLTMVQGVGETGSAHPVCRDRRCIGRVRRCGCWWCLGKPDSGRWETPPCCRQDVTLALARGKSHSSPWYGSSDCRD